MLSLLNFTQRVQSGSRAGEVSWKLICGICGFVCLGLLSVDRVVIACLFTQQEVPVPLHPLIAPAAKQIQLPPHTRWLKVPLTTEQLSYWPHIDSAAEIIEWAVLVTLISVNIFPSVYFLSMSFCVISTCFIWFDSLLFFHQSGCLGVAKVKIFIVIFC